LERVFDPFFTTKDVGEGSGLGLSMVYGFAKQSKGHAAIYSEIGHGTTVKIYLPKMSGVEEQADAIKRQMTKSLRGGEESLLVVEDDEAVRDILTSALRSVGYEVVEAADGEAARSHIASRDFDLLITDVILPGGMTGRDVANEALTRHPGIRVLYISGYARNAIVHQGKLDEGVDLLTKPFTRDALIRRVREMLDAAAD
jgi:CheY-like chemotaxis protein